MPDPIPSRASHPLKSYLGDAVYADFDGANVVLTTEDGIGTTNRIVLESQALAALNTYVERLRSVGGPQAQGRAR